MNILIVDDEPTYRILVGDFLREQGWRTYEAGNGVEGLKLLSSETIGFIISDIYMPIMDGLKFHKAVRENPQFTGIPFLFVSAFDDEYTMSAVKSMKSDGFLRKAKPLAELKAWINYLTTPLDHRGIPPSVSDTRPKLTERSDLRTARRSR